MHTKLCTLCNECTCFGVQAESRGTTHGSVEATVFVRKPREVRENSSTLARNSRREKSRVDVQRFESQETAVHCNRATTHTSTTAVNRNKLHPSVFFNFQEDNKIPFKLNTAAILREGRLYRERELKEIEK